MKITMKFNIPEDNQLYQDYLDGIKCKYLLQEFTQKWSKQLDEDSKVKAYDMLTDLYAQINDENINLF